jgi:cyclophilin family peptidyl-prolyl cis-trans isomerase
MPTQNRTLHLSTLTASILAFVMLAANLLLLPVSAVHAAPTDKRKPGLYWTFETDKGKIACKLYEAEAPVTVHTMVGLAIGKISYVHPETKQVERKKYFDGLIFDRVIPGVMIQGGDLLGTGVGHPEGPGFPYKSEIAPSLKFDAPGRLAMANSGPDTNDSHFFITEAAYPSFTRDSAKMLTSLKPFPRCHAIPGTLRSRRYTFSVSSSNA